MRVQAEGGKELVVARKGARAWEETYQVFDTFVHKAERPLQYVFADHCLLDVFVVDAREPEPGESVVADGADRRVFAGDCGNSAAV
jgi:hypothetical protein